MLVAENQARSARSTARQRSPGLADLEASGLADWTLQNWLLAFVIVVVLADGVVLGLAANSVRLTPATAAVRGLLA